MLYINLTSDRQIARHLGEDVQRYLADQVVEVQADGDELAHILCSMDGLPTTHKPVQRWFGDDAKFIVGNW